MPLISFNSYENQQQCTKAKGFAAKTFFNIRQRDGTDKDVSRDNLFIVYGLNSKTRYVGRFNKTSHNS